MKAGKTKQEPRWQKTPVANLVRNAASKMYYGRLRVGSKLIWKSLKTDRMSVAMGHKDGGALFTAIAAGSFNSLAITSDRTIVA